MGFPDQRYKVTILMARNYLLSNRTYCNYLKLPIYLSYCINVTEYNLLLIIVFGGARSLDTKITVVRMCTMLKFLLTAKAYFHWYLAQFGKFETNFYGYN